SGVRIPQGPPKTPQEIEEFFLFLINLCLIFTFFIQIS
ncbi:hypothetical protein RCH13_002807, partial [Chryseobacterium sp. MP_3.2]|nr:hypothetical protein [Chryseobacterium sp. MP_3.2]